MRTHKVQYRLAKERDYVVMETRQFFGELQSFLMFFKISQDWHPNAKLILDNLETAIKTHDMKAVSTFAEDARKFAWNTLRTPFESQGALLFSFFVWISSFSYVWSKTPEKYDEGLRPQWIRDQLQ